MMKAATTGAPIKMPSSSFSFRGAVSITQALLYFHILLAEASEPARRSKDNREQIQKRNSNGSELRYVKKEVELEDMLMYNDILGTDEPLPESTTRTTTLPAPWADSTPWADSNEIVNGEENSTNWDKLGDSNWVYVDDDDYFPNITEADDIFSGGATLESQVPSMSPSEINFQPVPQLENSEDSPLIELQVPSDNSIDPKIDQEPGSPVPVVSTTAEPSPPPIFPPTRAPTKPPTNKPTRVPTAVPTEAPTYEPTYEPTRIPTSQPSASPTRNPSALPTKTPTNKPTEVPTKLPTELPTELPTPRPTQQPTRTPSLRPTFRPTHLPTGGPTEPPTRIPTPRPTRKPTLRPTHLPTTEPTPRPSPVPTISNEPSPAPSGAPSLPLQTNDVSGVMDLSPLATELQRRDSLGWETVTENFIMRFLLSPEAGLSLKDTEIRADIVKQSILVQEGTGTTRRFLQDNSVESKKESLVIQYNLIIDYRSTSYDYDINELVWSAFDTPEKQAKYIKDLQDRSGVFDPVTEVEVEVDGYSPPRTPVPKPPDEGVDLAVIIGSSVGGVAFIMLIVLLCLRSRTGESVDEKAIAETQATPSTAKNIKVSTEILVEPQDDVSTLGDPMFGQGGMIMGGIERDEMTATYVY